jgi:hypothetical protein
MMNDSKATAISDLLTPQSSFEQCKLVLPEAGEGIISFQICGKYIINAGKLGETQKIGCKFVEITRPVEEVIQRYMLHIQRTNLQKED